MNAESVKAYIAKMPRKNEFEQLEPEDQEAQVFESMESLRAVYPERLMTDRVGALQTLFIIEAEIEEYGKLKRHCVENVSTTGSSISLGCNQVICPEVIRTIGKPRYAHGGRVARLS